MAEDADRAARVRGLKESRPGLTWRRIADAVGVAERSVSNWAATGAMSYENAGKLAAYFGRDQDWVWSGDRDTADLMGDLAPGGPGGVSQLDRIEAAVTRLAVRFEAFEAAQVDADALDRRVAGLRKDLAALVEEVAQAAAIEALARAADKSSREDHRREGEGPEH